LYRDEYTAAELWRILKVSRQGYTKHRQSQNKPPNRAKLPAEIKAIITESEYNDCYGRERIHDALKLAGISVSLRTVYRVCSDNGITKSKRKPKGLTKADKQAQKSDDLIKRDFSANAPNKKLVSDITQLPAKDGNLYISAVFDCFDNYCLGLSMADNMKTPLVIESFKAAANNCKISSAIFRTDRGSQYTSDEFRSCLRKSSVIQSMNSASGRCHDNAKCESMWARFKEEAVYRRINTKIMSMEEVKSMVFRYFIGYWNNRRISHSIGGLTTLLKRSRFFETFYFCRMILSASC
jgi:transposase InsO family protein